MENDSIRSVGSDTLVDIWIDDKMRSLLVSPEAIGAFLGFDKAAACPIETGANSSERTFLLIVVAAKQRLSETDRSAGEVVIDVGQLPRSDGRSGDRRTTNRRKDDRRKVSLSWSGQPERRKGDRRAGERRTRAPKKDT